MNLDRVKFAPEQQGADLLQAARRDARYGVLVATKVHHRPQKHQLENSWGEHSGVL